MITFTPLYETRRSSYSIILATYWFYQVSASVRHKYSHKKKIGKSRFKKESTRYIPITQNETYFLNNLQGQLFPFKIHKSQVHQEWFSWHMWKKIPLNHRPEVHLNTTSEVNSREVSKQNMNDKPLQTSSVYHPTSNGNIQKDIP